MSNLDKFVADYVNAFEADLVSFDRFQTGYMSNVNNRITDVMYSHVTPKNFVEKANSTLKETNSDLYKTVLTQKINIHLKKSLMSRLFHDLKELFSQGFEVVESDSNYLVLQRPATAFKNLEQHIEELYQEYVDAETDAQRKDYLELDKIDEYVTKCEEEEKAKAIKLKHNAMLEAVERINNEDTKADTIKRYLSALDTITTSDLRTELKLSKEDVSDVSLSNIFKLCGFEKKRTKAGNVWTTNNTSE